MVLSGSSVGRGRDSTRGIAVRECRVTGAPAGCAEVVAVSDVRRPHLQPRRRSRLPDCHANRRRPVHRRRTDAGEQQNRQRRRRARPRLRVRHRLRRIEQASNAIHQRSAVGRHRGPQPRRTLGFDRRQRASVSQRITAHRYRHVVAAEFALGANFVRDPPHGRVIEQQRLCHALQKVDQIIVAANVRQFVRQQALQCVPQAIRPALPPASGSPDAASPPPPAPAPATTPSNAPGARSAFGRSVRRACVAIRTDAGRAVPADRIRAAATHPPARRIENASAPHSHAGYDPRQNPLATPPEDASTTRRPRPARRSNMRRQTDEPTTPMHSPESAGCPFRSTQYVATGASAIATSAAHAIT